MREIIFEVYGLPVPQGSKRGFVKQDKKTGRTYAAVVDDDPTALRNWRALVIDAARQARIAAGVDSPFLAAAVEMMFTYPRPAGHFGAKGLLRSAPVEKVTAPDLDKLVRATYDSLKQAYVVLDDSVIVESHERKGFGEPKLRVAVTELELRQVAPLLEVTVDPAPEESNEQRSFRQFAHPGRDR